MNKLKCFSSDSSHFSGIIKNKSVLQLALSSVTPCLTYFDVERVETHSFRFDFLTH